MRDFDLSIIFLSYLFVFKLNCVMKNSFNVMWIKLIEMYLMDFNFNMNFDV